MKQSPVKYNKYTIEQKNANNGYLKNIEKYYDYYNIYKPKKNNIDTGRVIPNRKLSPILRKNL